MTLCECLLSVVEIKEVPSHVEMGGYGIDWDEISRDDIEVWGRLDTDVYILMRKNRDIYVELAVNIKNCYFSDKSSPNSIMIIDGKID